MNHLNLGAKRYQTKALCTGTLFDIANGSFGHGANNSAILDGGLRYIVSVGGKPQHYKSGILGSYVARALSNYNHDWCTATFCESENSVDGDDRLVNLAQGDESIRDRVRVLALDEIGTVEDMFDLMYSIVSERTKDMKNLIAETPFKDHRGKNIIAIRPHIFACDSWSGLRSSLFYKTDGKESLDSAKTNMSYAAEGNVKTKMFMRLPTYLRNAGICFISTAHLNKENSIGAGPMDNPYEKGTPNMKAKEKFTHVGNQYSFLSNSLVECRKVGDLNDKADRTKPFYPYGDDQNIDLKIIRAFAVKGKSDNGSGFEIPHISSQKYGIQPTLEYFHYMYEHGHGDHFGGRGRWTLPQDDTLFTRNLIRRRADEDHEFSRMMELIGQYCFLYDRWIDVRNPIMKPIDFIKGITDMGSELAHDVKNSTGIWQFVGEEGDRDYMSILDVHNIITGERKWKSKVKPLKGPKTKSTSTDTSKLK